MTDYLCITCLLRKQNVFENHAVSHAVFLHVHKDTWTTTHYHINHINVLNHILTYFSTINSNIHMYMETLRKIKLVTLWIWHFPDLLSWYGNINNGINGRGKRGGCCKLIKLIHWGRETHICISKLHHHYTPRTTKLLGGILVSLRSSVRPSVRLSRLPCPLCNIYSSGWILSILATNNHYHERVRRTQWPLTLTYIFKVIRPWLRKSCPLCSVYSSGWIIFIFGTNDHYH